MNAVELAAKMESDAIDFYAKAAEKTSHPAGKRIFLSIMEDEKRHLAMLNSIVKGMGITPDTPMPIARIKTIFEELKDKMVGGIAASADEKDALKIAMAMEKEGYEFYQKSADAAQDAKTRELFTRLVSEEKEHYAVFANTLNFLDDNGNWYMWEERGIVEG